MATLEVRDLTKSFGNTRVLRPINLDVAAGEFVVLLGPSGCGKSTLLNMIAGLESVDEGEIRIDDYVVTGWSLRTATSPWSFSPTRSIRD